MSWYLRSPIANDVARLLNSYHKYRGLQKMLGSRLDCIHWN